MMWSGAASGNGWLWFLSLVLAVLGAALIAVAVDAQRRKRSGQPSQAVRVLRERLARGDVDEAEYRDRLAVLEAAPMQDRSPRSLRRGPIVAAVAAAVLLLAAVSAIDLASRPGGWSTRAWTYPGPACRFPALGGQVVDVTLADMGGMMPGGMMGMMKVTVNPSTVRSGLVSFRARNVGGMVHELVVLPLPPGGLGSQVVGADGAVAEQGSLGEASKTCGGGTGDGIAPGGIGWVTLHLDPGRYELICNLPYHYAMGMFTELDVG